MRVKATTEVDQYIGARIRYFRRARRMSQSALASLLALTYQQIQKYEVAKCRVPATRLYRIAQLLDVPVDAFFPYAKAPLAITP